MRTTRDPAAPRDEHLSRRLTLFAALCASALFGALFGALCFINADGRLSELLETAQRTSIDIRRSGSIVRLIGSSLMSTGVYLLAAFLLGFSALAQPFELALPFLRGITAGVVLTSVYSGGACKGTLLTAAAVFPGILISVILIVLASREAIYMSSRLFGICFHDRLYQGLLKRAAAYSVGFAELLAATSVSALLDCLLAVVIFGRK
ncbi:MAG: hypothetical protein IIZ73_06035 [Ruminococcus sp.]|nr:hypothetical protein [Ruminococcus sp.]MCR5142303.1 hypothetical protein [Ruminococcus sp.]